MAMKKKFILFLLVIVGSIKVCAQEAPANQQSQESVTPYSDEILKYVFALRVKALREYDQASSFSKVFMKNPYKDTSCIQVSILDRLLTPCFRGWCISNGKSHEGYYCFCVNEQSFDDESSHPRTELAHKIKNADVVETNPADGFHMETRWYKVDGYLSWKQNIAEVMDGIDKLYCKLVIPKYEFEKRFEEYTERSTKNN